MPVISFANSKGGVRKSTSAQVFAQHNSSVTLIDADPNQPLKKWVERDPKRAPESLHIVPDVNEEADFTTKHARPAKKRYGRTLKKSPRTTQFNMRLKPETTDKFWAGTKKEGMIITDDFLAHLLDLYEVRER